MGKVCARIHLNLRVALAVAAVLAAGMAILLVYDSLLDKPPWEGPAQTMTPADPWPGSTKPADDQATTGTNSGAYRIRSNAGVVVPVPLPVPVARDGFGSNSPPQPLTVPSFFPPTVTMIPVPSTVPAVDLATAAPVSPAPPVTIGATSAAPTFIPAVTPTIIPVVIPSGPAKPTVVFTPTATPVVTPSAPPTPTLVFAPTVTPVFTPTVPPTPVFTPTPDPTQGPTPTVPPPPPTVDMNLSASANTVQVGSSLVVEVWVHPRHNSRVDAAQVFLAFEPSILQVLALNWGNQLEEQLYIETDNASGRAGLAAGTLGSASSSRFKLASVEFLAVGVTGPPGSTIRLDSTKGGLFTRTVYRGVDNTGRLGPSVVVVVREPE